MNKQLQPSPLLPRPDTITASGQWIYFDQPNVESINMKDVKVHSFNICRYNGAIKWHLIRHHLLTLRLLEHHLLTLSEELIDFYQRTHDKQGFTILAETLGDGPNMMVIQLGYAGSHDFHEVIVQDIVTGMKPSLKGYKELESTWEEVMHQAIGLDLEWRNDDFIRMADNRALITEMTFLDHPATDYLSDIYGPASIAELEIIAEVAAMSKKECWREIKSVIKTARKELNEWLKNQTNL